MQRRGFLLAAGGALLAGCARVAPSASEGTPSTPLAAPLVIGDDGTPTGSIVAQLLSQALTAKGRVATVARAGDEWQASLGKGTLAALPCYAATLWSQLDDAQESPSGVDDLISGVAGMVAPEVSMLAARGVQGGLVWLVTAKTAAGGIRSLDRIASWSKGKVVAIPSLAASRADGIPGITGVYHGLFTLATLDDPVQRAAQLVSGRVALAAFRRADYTGASNLVELADPEKIEVVDPLVVLLDAKLANNDPDAVLTLNGVSAILTTDVLVELQGNVAEGAAASDVARRWLATKGMA